MKRKWKLALIAVGLCILALRACALSGGPVSGQVIDETTGKPVADAIVVAHWHGSWTKIVGESSSACYHVETARTDAEGEYQIAAWTRPWFVTDLRFTSDGQTYDIYKPGYWRGSNDTAAPKTLYIAPFKGSKEAYFEIVLTSPAWGCERAGASGMNEYRLFKAMASEGRALAETPAQIGRAEMLHKLAEESLVNFDRPTHYVGSRLENIDPKDSFKREEVPQ
jgi:hypothetical protein